MFNFNTQIIRLNNNYFTRYYDSGGNGEAVILLHGLALSIEIWGKIIDGLKDKFRVLAFDFPGFGQADKPNVNYDSEFFGEQIIAFMDTLNIENAHLIGSSLGGSTLVRLSKKHQHRMNKIILMAPGGFGRECNIIMRAPSLPLIGYILGTPSYSSNKFSMSLSMADKNNVTHELLETITKYSSMKGYQRAFIRCVKSGIGPFGVKNVESFRECARNIKCDCLIIWGKQDKVFPLFHANIAHELIENSKLAVIENCGHYPHWEQAESFLKYTIDFLKI